MILIGITGRTKNKCISRSGKTTVANEIQVISMATVYSFANPIRRMIKAGLGIDCFDQLLEYGDSKTQKISWLSTKEKDISIRYLMESLGTGWGRNMLREDLWLVVANRFLNEYRDKTNIVVISDIRFQNEMDFVRSNGGVMIHVCRPNYNYKQPIKNDLFGILGILQKILNIRHKSNKALPISDCDHVIINNAGIDNLKDSVRTVLDDIIREFYEIPDNANITYSVDGSIQAHYQQKIVG